MHATHRSENGDTHAKEHDNQAFMTSFVRLETPGSQGPSTPLTESQQASMMSITCTSRS